MLVYSIFWPVLVYSTFWSILVYYRFWPVLVYSIFWPTIVSGLFWSTIYSGLFWSTLYSGLLWSTLYSGLSWSTLYSGPILIYYIFWPIVAHSSLNRDYRQFCSFNREVSNFRFILAGAGSERALLSRARVSGRKGSFEQTSPWLAIRSPHRQTTKGEPLSSELVDQHITIHYIFILF